jgi:hypothetical protein
MTEHVTFEQLCPARISIARTMIGTRGGIESTRRRRSAFGAKQTRRSAVREQSAIIGSVDPKALRKAFKGDAVA